jgi:2-aminoadipate transaminase
MVEALSRTADVSLQVQIADSLRDRMVKGVLAEGDRLPTSRELAGDLGVSRSTVVRAYEQLEREGWIHGRVGMGTVVTGRKHDASTLKIDWNHLLTARVQESDPEYAELFRMLSQTDLVSFAGGLPSPEFFPGEALQHLSSEVLKHQGAKLLQWCPIEGYPPLRSWIAERMGCAPENVMILSGSTQGIHLLAQALIDPGDVVLIEAPTYAGAIRAFRGAGARLVSIPSGADGIDLDRLRSVLRHVRPKLLYVIPTFQNPTGGCLSPAKRHELVEIAGAHGLPVIEDDPYSTLRYEGSPAPSLHALDRNGNVLYLSTFSKSLFPGLRVGWLVAPEELLPRLTSLRNVIDLFTNSLAQGGLYEFCKRGMFDAHLQRVRSEYRQRRDVMAAALRQYCAEVSFDLPSGGLFIWGELPEGVDSRELLREAIALKVGFVNGSLFYADEKGGRRLRLSFACHPPDEIHDGIRRLGLALKRVRQRGSGTKEQELTGFVV